MHKKNSITVGWGGWQELAAMLGLPGSGGISLAKSLE